MYYFCFSPAAADSDGPRMAAVRRTQMFRRPFSGKVRATAPGHERVFGTFKLIHGHAPIAGARPDSDIETCPICVGAARIIACIQGLDGIARIVAHVDGKAAEPQAPKHPPCRAPPQRALFD